MRGDLDRDRDFERDLDLECDLEWDLRRGERDLDLECDRDLERRRLDREPERDREREWFLDLERLLDREREREVGLSYRTESQWLVSVGFATKVKKKGQNTWNDSYLDWVKFRKMSYLHQLV